MFSCQFGSRLFLGPGINFCEWHNSIIVKVDEFVALNFYSNYFQIILKARWTSRRIFEWRTFFQLRIIIEKLWIVIRICCFLCVKFGVVFLLLPWENTFFMILAVEFLSFKFLYFHAFLHFSLCSAEFFLWLPGCRWFLRDLQWTSDLLWNSVPLFFWCNHNFHSMPFLI